MNGSDSEEGADFSSRARGWRNKISNRCSKSAFSRQNQAPGRGGRGKLGLLAGREMGLLCLGSPHAAGRDGDGFVSPEEFGNLLGFGGCLKGKGVFKAGGNHPELLFFLSHEAGMGRGEGGFPGWDNYQHDPGKKRDLKEQETPARFPSAAERIPKSPPPPAMIFPSQKDEEKPQFRAFPVGFSSLSPFFHTPNPNCLASRSGQAAISPHSQEN